jgi:MFS family permease
MTDSPARPIAGLRRNGDFLRLWAAQAVSLVGSQVTVLALPLTAVIVLHATPLQVGALFAVQYAPYLLLGLPAGVWVDRLPRRPILIATDLARTVVLLSVPAGFLLGNLSLGLLYAAALAAGALSLFFDVAHQSYLPALVERDQLVGGNARLQVTYSGAQLAGPSLGGLLVQVVGGPLALVADAASFLVSAALLATIRRPERTPAPPADRSGLVHGIGEGLRFVLRHRLLRPLAVTMAFGNLFDLFGMAQAILALYAIRELRMSPATFGLALAIANAGAVLGAVLNGRMVRRWGLGGVIAGSAVLPGLAVLALPLATPATALPVLAAALAVAWFSIAVFNVNQVSLRQALTPAEMQGRMNATMRFIIWGTLPLGTLLGGALGGTIGLRQTLLLAGAGSVISYLPLLHPGIRRMRSIDAAGAPRMEGALDG